MPRILVVDNYDSFTFNLVQYLGELGAEVVVVRNDERSVEDVDIDGFDGLVISPGPGTPDDTGNSPGFLDAFAERRKAVLGVCLGHQLIIEHYGGTVGLADEVRHGKTSEISHDRTGVFADIESPMVATRYHSLTGVELPEALVVTATSDDDGTVQGVRHTELPIHGVQFHPESVLTEEGKHLLGNFLDAC